MITAYLIIAALSVFGLTVWLTYTDPTHSLADSAVSVISVCMLWPIALSMIAGALVGKLLRDVMRGW